MGFFASRKAEPTVLPASRSLYTVSGGESQRSVIRLIRSRFYGKTKEKRPRENERPPEPSVCPQQSVNSLSVASCIAESAQSHNEQQPDFREQIEISTRRMSTIKNSNRSSADVVTITLAQRLNELAVANGEGLLDDDEYRLLRQSLFDRFATSASVPVEVPVVKSVLHNNRRSGPSTIRSKPSSHISISRPPSIQSQLSAKSSMSNFFRRNTVGKNYTPSKRDDESVISTSSRKSSTFPHSFIQRSLGRQPSDASLRTQGSRTPHDMRSISSRKTGKSVVGDLDAKDSSLRGVGRSSSKLAEPPPSSFMTRNASNVLVDTNHLTTSTEIREEIQNTEEEGRRLLDAFNGLELSALTRHNPHHSSAHSHPNPLDLSDSTWTLIPTQYRGAQTRGLSLPRGASVTRNSQNGAEAGYISRERISLGRKPSTLSTSKSRLQQPPLPSLPMSLIKLDPVFDSTNESTTNTMLAPLLPLTDDPLTQRPPSSNMLLENGPTGGLSLAVWDGELSRQAAAPRANESQDGGKAVTYQAEMEDIRRRKAEMINRYQQRLEFLRAKLKGAEMHERLLRK